MDAVLPDSGERIRSPRLWLLPLAHWALVFGCAEARPFVDEQKEPLGSAFPSGSEGGTGSGGGSFQATLGSGCEPPDTTGTSLAEEALDPAWPVSGVLYGWLSEAEAASLRAGAPLGATPGAAHLVRTLLTVAQRLPGSVEALVADGFQQAHSAWPAPWATRLDAPETTAGDRLVRLVLREDAWIGELREEGILARVTNLAGDELSVSQVRENPERLVALLHTHWDPARSCDAADTPSYREFLVRNSEEFVTYELGTDRIRQRIEQDALHLEEYMKTVRSCPPSSPTAYRDLSCMALATYEPYLVTLAHPTEAYRPTAAHLADLIGVLRQDVASWPDLAGSD